MKTLVEARQQFNNAIKDKGVNCPCCGRWGKINGYQITSTQVMGMLWMLNNFRKSEWIDIGKAHKMILRSKPLATLRHWELVEKKPKDLKEDKRASGLWRLTPKGRDFLRKKIALPKYAFVFNSRLVKYSKQEIDVVQALGKKFSYEEVMKTKYRTIK